LINPLRIIGETIISVVCFLNDILHQPNQPNQPNVAITCVCLEQLQQLLRMKIAVFLFVLLTYVS